MKKEGNIFAVLVNWKDDGTSIVCGICNEFFDFRKIYSLTPKNNEGEKALNNFLGEASNWSICKECITKFERKTGCRIQKTDIETVALYEHDQDEEDLRMLGAAIEKINAKPLLCPMCKGEMDITLGGPTDFDQKHTLVKHNTKIECQKCGFRYSDDKTFTLYGEVIDHNDKTLLIKVIKWPRTEPDENVSKEEQFESRNVSYPHNNFHPDALDTLCSMGEMLEFLIVNNMIVRILTGWE